VSHVDGGWIMGERCVGFLVTASRVWNCVVWNWQHVVKSCNSL